MEPAQQRKRYGACQRVINVSASGVPIRDGCQEFDSDENDTERNNNNGTTTDARRCAACGCHRSFHLVIIDGPTTSGRNEATHAVQLHAEHEHEHKHEDEDTEGESEGEGADRRRVSKTRIGFRPFEAARDVVWAAGLKTRTDFLKWSKDGHRPLDIPSAPEKVYEGAGWISWGDWLGTDKGKSRYCCAQKPRDVEFRPFEDCRTYMWSLGFRSQAEFHAWTKSGMRPVDVPASPYNIYRHKGWVSWPDFLGIAKGKLAQVRRPESQPLRPFLQAREYVWTLGLKSQSEYKRWKGSGNRPLDIPAAPDKVYQHLGWLSWSDFLGREKGKVAKPRKLGKPADVTSALMAMPAAGVDEHMHEAEHVASSAVSHTQE